MTTKNFESNPFYNEQGVEAPEAAHYIGCSDKHVLRMARDGKIPAYTIGDGMKRRHFRFLLSELDKWRRSRDNSIKQPGENTLA